MHLTTDEILNFITMESLTQENVTLAAQVNSHIMQCDECRKKVEAFQALNDKLSGTILSDKKHYKNDPDKGIKL